MATSLLIAAHDSNLAELPGKYIGTPAVVSVRLTALSDTVKHSAQSTRSLRAFIARIEIELAEDLPLAQDQKTRVVRQEVHRSILSDQSLADLG